MCVHVNWSMRIIQLRHPLAGLGFRQIRDCSVLGCKAGNEIPQQIQYHWKYKNHLNQYFSFWSHDGQFLCVYGNDVRVWTD